MSTQFSCKPNGLRFDDQMQMHTLASVIIWGNNTIVKCQCLFYNYNTDEYPDSFALTHQCIAWSHLWSYGADLVMASRAAWVTGVLVYRVQGDHKKDCV